MLLPSTISFLEALSIVGKSDNWIITKRGRPELGGDTLFNEDVGIEYARWVDPGFAIWCNDRIKELRLQLMLIYFNLNNSKHE